MLGGRMGFRKLGTAILDFVDDHVAPLLGNALVLAIFLVPISLGLVFVGLLGLQVYAFLQSGVWIGISVLDVLKSFGVQWAIAPDSWLGIHQIIAQLPLSFVLGGVTLLAYFFAAEL